MRLTMKNLRHALCLPAEAASRRRAPNGFMNVVRFELQSEICNLKSEINMSAQRDLLEN